MQARSTRGGWLVLARGLPWLITPWGRTVLKIGQAIGMAHTDETAIGFLGGVQLAQGEMAGAERSYANAPRRPPDMAEDYRGLGEVYIRRGLLELTLNACRQGLALDRGEPDAYLSGACRASEVGRREPPCLTGERIRLLAPGRPGWMELHEARAR